MFSKEARLFPGWYDVVGFVEQQSVTWVVSVQLFAHILCNRMFFALSNKYVPPCGVGCSQSRHVHARRVWCRWNCRTERVTWTFSVELIAHILSNIIFWIFDKKCVAPRGRMLPKHARPYSRRYGVTGAVWYHSVTSICSVELLTHILCCKRFFDFRGKYVSPCS